MQEKGKKEHKKEDKEDSGALAQEYKETLQRLQAEFENSRKRAEKERQEHEKFANSSLLKEFLPLVDSISEALKAAKKHNQNAEALEKIGAQLLKILERNGIKMIETTGKKFDFNVHECLLTSHEKEKEDGIILEELQKGYMLNGKILRPAKVRVNKKTE
ncbi:MAG: nucleotide exchange factor GrpE [archaeon]